MIYDAMARRHFKIQARQNIREAFWPTMGAVLLQLVPAGLLSLIFSMLMPDETQTAALTDAELYRVLLLTLAAVAVMWFILSPLQYGLWQYMTARVRGQNPPAAMVFAVFADIRLLLNALLLPLCVLVRSIGWVVLWFVAITCSVIVSLYLGTLGAFVAVILCILVSVFVYAKIRRYDGAYVLLADNPNFGVWAAAKSCVPMFRGHLWELVAFDLSFFWWQMLSYITLGVVGVYVTAYTELSFVHYVDRLCGRQEPTLQL